MMMRTSNANAPARMRVGTTMGARGATPCAVHTMAAKIRQASVKWKANRYCDTLTRSERPEATIHQPIAPSAAPRAKIVHNRARSGGSTHPRQRNQANGTRNTPPTSRASSRRDRLKLVEAHPRMALAVLRDGLVLVELGLPCAGVERRHDAGHRLPFHDRQARLGEPRCPAHRERHEHQGCHCQQPKPEGAAAGLGTRSKTGHAIIGLPAAMRTI